MTVRKERSPSKLTMMIVEDDDGLRPSLELSFSRRGHEVIGVASVAEAARHLQERSIALVLLDIQLPDGSGLDVLRAAQDVDPDTVVVMMTAFPEIKTAVRAMKDGASDFVVKPFDLEDLHLTVERAIEVRSLRRDVRRLERESRLGNQDSDILGESTPVKQLRDEIAKAATADTPVLVVGETGTGKELVADSIHALSNRFEAPLVKVNCSAFSEQLLESELFGHEKGAFTDAREARAGVFEMADGGTLFLDEISEMKPGLQAKLLRVVEGHPFRKVGGQREIWADVHVLAATNRDLKTMLESGALREDLYFRLNVFQIRVPPLRERGDDVVLLARFFLRRSASTLRKSPLELAGDAEETLVGYDWPGNIRELQNVMERAAILCDGGEVGVEHLPIEVQSSAFVQRQAPDKTTHMPSLDEIERRYVAHVTRRVNGNLSQAARILGIARNTLKAKLESDS